MSEVNVRKWHKLFCSSHFSSKLAHAKIKLETFFKQPVAIDVDRFVFLFDANPTVALWDLREAIRIQALLSLVVNMKQQPRIMENYNNRRQSMCQ